MGTKKRNHIVPVMTLKGFCNSDGMIWVYDRRKDTYLLQSPKDTAVIKNYYSFYTNDGERNRDIEDMLAQIEGSASGTIKRLATVTTLSDGDRRAAAEYAAWQYTRTPAWQQQHEGMIEQLFQGISSFYPDLSEDQYLLTWGKEGSEPTPTKRDKKWKGVRVEVPRIMSLAAMLDVTPKLAELMSKLDWQVWVPPKRCSFITSDNPFTLHAPRPDPETHLFERGVGLLTQNTLKVLPLSSSHCLVMGDPGIRFARSYIDQRRTRHLNWLTAMHCDRFLYAQSRPLLESIVKATGLSQRGEIRGNL